VVIGHTINSYKLLLLVKLFTRSKIVLEMHGFIEEEDKLIENISRFKYILLKCIFRFFYKTCDLITTCSDTATKEICPYNKNTFTVFGGVDTSLFSPRKMLPHEGIVIGYAGSVRIWQGLQFLVDTFITRKLHQQGYELQLLLSQEYSLPEEAHSIKILSSVSPEEVPNFLSLCDILVIPRENNEVNRLSFPSKLIEYMAMGVPVVASRTSDMHKIITHGKNGMLFDPGNAEDLYNCIIELSANKEYRRSIGEEASTYVSLQYTWEKQAKILIQEIKTLF
jgi:glycosyltransferase involved in cell wall biosynthesis